MAMNDPIISPWIFYLAYLAKMSFVLLVAGVIFAVLAVAVYSEVAEKIENLERKLEAEKEQVKYYMSLDEKGNDSTYTSAVKLHLKLRDDAEEVLDEAKEKYRPVRKSVLKACVLSAALIGLWAIIPNETTIYRMVVAQYVTPHNLQVTGETIENIVDKTVDKILKLKEDK